MQRSEILHQVESREDKGSVERSLLPWAIILFFFFYTKQALKTLRTPLHAVFYWNVKGKTRKKLKNTDSFVASLGAGVQPRSTVQRSYLSAVSKNRRFSSFFLGFGYHLARKSLSWPAMPISNKKQEFQQRKRNKLFDDFCVCAYQFDFARGAGLEHGRWKQSIF